MAIPHAHPGQVVEVRPFGSRLPDERTAALFKASNLEVMRLVLHAGKSLPSHKVPGEITIHCLEGVFSVSAEGINHILRAGQLLYLPGNVIHSVLAMESASALVTIALVKSA